ncbi:MAG: metallophosphoesterase [Pseudomonadota bacterium]
MPKIVVLSDLHLRPPGDTANGLDPHARLVQGIDWLNQQHSDADLCVLAGDLADLGQIDAYRCLKHQIIRAKVRVEMTIGNHDDRDSFVSVFGAERLSDTGFVDKAIDLDGYRILLLDSAVTGEPMGRLDPAQLTWLVARLDEAADRPVIVILHHHANPQHGAVDRINLQNGVAFARVLSRHKDIRQVIAGHVHTTSTAIWKGMPFTTLAGGHTSASALHKGAASGGESSPAQMAVILAGRDSTIVHFDDYVSGSAARHAN